MTTWRKSSYSGHDAGNCIEIAPHIPGFVPVRDSKRPHGPALVFSAPAWNAFVAATRSTATVRTGSAHP
ncbi:DUF397 domain-containing protein [Streptomyces sp. NPDC021096]|uniref:DUF397 domain-containing protein n=1 Tax=Streptomyces sp. NPDC021096 TaxID=3154792 RepID=UPI00340F2C74